MARRDSHISTDVHKEKKKQKEKGYGYDGSSSPLDFNPPGVAPFLTDRLAPFPNGRGTRSFESIDTSRVVVPGPWGSLFMTRRKMTCRGAQPHLM